MSTAEAAAPAGTPSLLQTALGDLEHELGSTRRVLERVPDAHFDWKPHDKSWPMKSLAGHVSHLPGWVYTILTTDELDLAGMPPNAAPADSAELLATFDHNVETLRAAAAVADDASLHRPWTLRMGEHTILTMPKLAVLRGMGVNHIIHHRAQLTVYLRLLDVPVPGLYGPSADEKA